MFTKKVTFDKRDNSSDVQIRTKKKLIGPLRPNIDKLKNAKVNNLKKHIRWTRNVDKNSKYQNKKSNLLMISLIFSLLINIVQIVLYFSSAKHSEYDISQTIEKQKSNFQIVRSVNSKIDNTDMKTKSNAPSFTSKSSNDHNGMDHNKNEEGISPKADSDEINFPPTPILEFDIDVIDKTPISNLEKISKVQNISTQISDSTISQDLDHEDLFYDYAEQDNVDINNQKHTEEKLEKTFWFLVNKNMNRCIKKTKNDRKAKTVYPWILLILIIIIAITASTFTWRKLLMSRKNKNESTPKPPKAPQRLNNPHGKDPINKYHDKIPLRVVLWNVRYANQTKKHLWWCKKELMLNKLPDVIMLNETNTIPKINGFIEYGRKSTYGIRKKCNSMILIKENIEHICEDTLDSNLSYVKIRSNIGFTHIICAYGHHDKNIFKETKNLKNVKPKRITQKSERRYLLNKWCKNQKEVI